MPPPLPCTGATNGGCAGAVVDASLYGSVLRVFEWTIAAYDRLGVVRDREGNRLANSAPLDNYPTADGRIICIVAGSDSNFARLCVAMGQPELVDDARFGTLVERAAHGDDVNEIVARWTSALPAAEIEAHCVAHDVPVATAYTAVDICTDPHLAARGDIVTVDDPVIGPGRQQSPYPRYVGERVEAPAGAPRLGAHNREAWCDLVGLSEEELATAQAAGVM